MSLYSASNLDCDVYAFRSGLPRRTTRGGGIVANAEEADQRRIGFGVREADESGAVAVFLGEQADVDAWFKAEAITCDQCVKQSTPIVQTLVHRRDVQIQVQKIHIGLKWHYLGGRHML